MNKLIAMLDSESCDWLVGLLLPPTPTILFPLDHKRQSRKRNRKKWIRSDSSYSHFVELITPLKTPISDIY